MTQPLPTAQRFTNRVPYYHLYRPRYPQTLTTLLSEKIGLMSHSVIADIGAGTGISCEPFLNYGCAVTAVEPNADMRAVSEQYYGQNPRFRAIDAAAERTTLPDSSVDVVVAGQAFHWFNYPAARAEFARILKPAGWVVLMWNDRMDGVEPFVDAFNAVLVEYDIEKGTTARVKDIINTDEDIADFYGAGGFVKHQIDHPISYTWEQVVGRALSASYAPLHDHPSHEPFMAALRAAFDTHQQDGLVWMHYITQVYCGQITGASQ
jgi:SAM-dependent methyltransferase